MRLSGPKLKEVDLAKVADKDTVTSSIAVLMSRVQLLDNIATMMMELDLRIKVFSFHRLPECQRINQGRGVQLLVSTTFVTRKASTVEHSLRVLG